MAVTYSKTSGIAKLYVDGVEVASSSFGSFNLNTGGDLYIGLRPSVSFTSNVVSFRGAIDEARIYGRAFSGAEIDALAAELQTATIDQQVTGPFTLGQGFGGFVGDGSPKSIGQEFVPNLAILTAVDLAITGPASGDVRVEIRDGTFDGTIIGTVTEKVFPTVSVPPFTHFRFPQPVSLLPGQTYVLRMTDVGMGGAGALGRVDNPYLQGRMLSNNPFPFNANHDLMFRAYAPLSDPFAWGSNEYGQLGNADHADTAIPGTVGSLTDVVQVAGGQRYTLLLKDDGTVWTTGLNQNGQRGNGNTTDSDTPVQVRDPSDSTTFLTDVVTIASGNAHALAIKSDGSLWTWGAGFTGQLGDGSQTNRPFPVQVIDNAGGFLSGVVGVAAGNNFSMALTSDGSVWAWGTNGNGQLGRGHTTGGPAGATPQPVLDSTNTSLLTDVTSIGAGNFQGFAVGSGGIVWGWGSRFSGRLGDGGTSTPYARSIPALVQDANGAITGVVSVDSGSAHTLALKGNGTVWAWGTNGSGQIGDGSNIQRSTAVQVAGPDFNNDPSDIINGVIAIAVGDNHSMALTSDNLLWVWGSNSDKQLGNESPSSSNIPLSVKNPNDASGLLTGVLSIGAGEAHSLGLASSIDVTPPVINLLGANPIDVEVGDAYVEPGATVTDDVDTGLTAVIDASAVDTNTLGSYSVTYDATDNSGNDAVQVIRTVNVVDTTAPTLTLPSDVEIEATSPTGAFHTYSPAVSAADNVNPNPVVGCAPASGSEFTFGVNTVTCSANGAFPGDAVTWLPAEGNADDAASNNDGVLVGGAGIGPGTVGQAFSFDGIDDYIGFPTSGFLASDMTVSLWFKLDSWNGHDDIIQHSTDGFNANRFSLERGGGFNGCVGDKINLITANAASQVSALCTSTSFSLNTWYHIAFTIDPSANTQIFVNGVLENDAASANVPSVIDSSFFLGRNWGLDTARLFDGFIDEVRIYDRALSQSEILANFVAPGNASTGAFTVTVVDTTAPVFDPALVDIETETTDPAGLNVEYTPVATDAVNPNPYVSCDPESGSLFPTGIPTDVTCTAYDGLSDGIVSCWAADGDGNDSVDGNIGTLAGDATYATGVSGQAFIFDGTGDYVQIGDQPNLTFNDSMTMAAWIYPTGPGNGAGGGIVVNKGGQYEFARFGDGTIQWAFANTSPGWAWIDTSFVAPENEWTHIAIVYDGDTDTVITYANGAQVHSLSVVGSIGDIGYPLPEFRIGGRAGATQDFVGRIDDVKIYGRALQANEIPANTLSPGNQNASPFTVTVTLIGLTVDIKPESVTNPLNLSGRGVLPVAILGGGIDLNAIDIDSLRLSAVDQVDPNEPNNPQVPVAHIGGHDLEDVNGDEIDDLMLHFRYADLEIPFDWIGPAFVDLILTGVLTDNTEVDGTDFVSLRPVSANIVNNLNGLGLGPDFQTKPGNGPKEGNGPGNGNGAGGDHWFFGGLTGEENGGNGNNGNDNAGGNGNNGNDNAGGNGNNGNDNAGGNGNNGNDDPGGNDNNGNDDPGGNENNGNGDPSGNENNGNDNPGGNGNNGNDDPGANGNSGGNGKAKGKK